MSPVLRKEAFQSLGGWLVAKVADLCVTGIDHRNAEFLVYLNFKLASAMMTSSAAEIQNLTTIFISCMPLNR